MSIIHVMDSSKSGRAIYVAASSLIVVAIATSFLWVQGIEVTLTVDNTLILVPFVGGLSLLFLSAKLEMIVVEWFSVRRMNGKKEKKEIKLQMAAALFYISPWESSPKEEYTIEKSLDLDLKRMLRSPQFRGQISELQQVFWILFLLPFTLIDIILIYSMNWLLVIAALVLGCLAASLIMWRNRKILNRILSHAYASWFLEGTSTDLERRKASIRMKSRQEERLEASLELAKPVIDLATKGEWEGFDRKSRNLEDLVGIPGYDTLRWNAVKDYILFLDWCASNIHNIHSSHVDISLGNGSTQVESAISVLRKCCKSSFNEEEELIAEFLILLTRYTKNRETYLDFNIEFYEDLEIRFLTELGDGVLDTLGHIPFRLKGRELPGSNSETKGIDRLSWLLVNAAERRLLDIQRSLSVVAAWGTYPTTIMKAAGPLVVKILLENDVGFSIDALQSIAPQIIEQLKQDDRTDPISVLEHMGELKKNYPRNVVRKYAIALQWDTIRSRTGEPHNAIEAITKFIDDFDKT